MADDSSSPERPPAPKRSASALIATGILLSRLSGLIRESILGSFIGLGAAADALGTAIRLPNVMQMLLGEGALSASFIPVYAAELDEDEEEAGRIAGAVASILALISAVLVVLGVIFARPLAKLIAWGFDDEKLDMAASLMRITFPGAGILVLSAWCLGVLNSHRRFFLSYVAPVLWNVAQIAVVVAAVVFFGVDELVHSGGVELTPTNELTVLSGTIRAAAWGLLAGSILQFLVQVPTVAKLASNLRFRLDTNRPGVREVRRRFGGALLGRGVVQISALIDVFLASLLVDAAVGALVKTQVLYVLPISIFAVSVAASELPELSRIKDPGQIRDRAQAGFRRISFFVGFAAIAYILLGDTIVGTIYERGNFNSDDTLLVWLALAAYSLALPASAVSRLTQNTLWSQGDTAGPARIAVVRLITASVVSVAVMWAFDAIKPSDVRDLLPTLSDAPDFSDPAAVDALRFGAVGITLGSAVSGWVEAILLWRLARKAVPGVSPLRPLKSLAPALGTAAVVAVVMRFVVDGWWTPLAMVVAVGLSGLSYVGVARATGVAEVNHLLVGPLKRLRR